jgi:hypothetical protein
VIILTENALLSKPFLESFLEVIQRAVLASA